MGLPARGSTLKLVPVDGKLEARFKGPHITPGYWRQPDLTAKAFDEEGFYKIGDALKFEDENNPLQGLLFDGRIAEDFKLGTGTWVSVGPLRAAFISHFAPYVRDVVIGGADRDYIGVIIVPDVESLRAFAPELPKTRGGRGRARPSGREGEVQRIAGELRKILDRLVQPRDARDAAGRAAVARCRRDHRQGLDQPARGVEPPQGDGGGTVFRSAVGARHHHRQERPDMSEKKRGIGATFTDAWLVEGVRTPFADYNGAARRDLADRSRHQGRRAKC